METDISDKPMGRLTRLAAVARDAIEAHPEYDEKTDRYLMSINDDDHGGFYASGYDGPAELIVDLMEHAKGTLESINGGTMEFVPDAEEGMVIHLRFTKQPPGAVYQVADGSIRAAIILAFVPVPSGG
jgi:hypothetical protein